MGDEEQGISQKDLGLPEEPGDRAFAPIVQGVAELVPQPFQETEETPEQKISVVMNGVREANSKLGGKVAAEVSLGQGRSTFFFASAAPNAKGENIVYGVDSIRGPIYVSGDLSKRLLPAGISVDFQQASTVTESEVRDWAHGDIGEEQMNDWTMAFEDSKKAVLRDQREMQRIREATNRRLDRAKSVVSKPIDIGAAPSPRATAEPSVAMPVSSAAGK